MGCSFILPFIFVAIEKAEDGLKHNENSLGKMLITILGELPAIILAYVLVERRGFGRKNTLSLAYTGSVSFFLMCCFADSRTLVALLFVARFFVKLTLAVLVPLTAEVFPTNIRTTGIGFVSGFGRLGPTIMPFLSIYLLRIELLCSSGVVLTGVYYRCAC